MGVKRFFDDLTTRAVEFNLAFVNRVFINDVDYPNNKKFRTNLILHNYNANGFFVFEVWTTYKGVVL